MMGISSHSFRRVSLGLVAIVGVVSCATLTACGGDSKPSEEEALIQLAEDHQDAFSDFNAEAVCGPMSRNAAAEFEENADSAIESDGGTFESDIPGSANEFCEYRIYENRDELLDLRQDDPERAAVSDALLELNRAVVFNSVDIDETGIFATVSSEPTSFEELGIDFRNLIPEEELEEIGPEELRKVQNARLQAEYALVKENDQWLVEEGRTFLSAPGEEQEETDFFPFE